VLPFQVPKLSKTAPDPAELTGKPAVLRSVERRARYCAEQSFAHPDTAGQQCQLSTTGPAKNLSTYL
jgi:hypothetical protein